MKARRSFQILIHDHEFAHGNDMYLTVIHYHEFTHGNGVHLRICTCYHEFAHGKRAAARDLGQRLSIKRRETEHPHQNYLYAHLLKGFLFIYIYIYTHVRGRPTFWNNNLFKVIEKRYPDSPKSRPRT